jgi:hypothetical protein
VDGGVGVGGERAGAEIDVEAQDRGEEIAVDALAVGVLVVGAALVAEGKVEVAVGAEGEFAAVVVGGLVALGKERQLGGGIGEVGIGGGNAVAREAVVQTGAGGRRGVEGEPDVEKTVARVVGVEGEGQQALFAGAAADEVGEVEEDAAGRGGREGVENEDAAGFLDDKEAVGLAGRGDEGDGLADREGGEDALGGVIGGGRNGR